MEYEGVILTGTSGGGKSTLARELVGKDDRFAIVKAVTTRAQRPDDPPGAYDYITANDIDNLESSGELMIRADYRDERYGIRGADFETVKSGGQIPILIITPHAADKLDGIANGQTDVDNSSESRFLSVFVDAPDDTLDERLRARAGGADLDPSVSEQRKADRSKVDCVLYSIKNLDLGSSLELLISLWEDARSGGVLPARTISLMLKCGMLLEDASHENVMSASYDLSLGDEYFYGGKIERLSDKTPILMIEPYDYAIVTSNEQANLPRDVSARFDLSVGLFCQGIILSNGPQVDPGFRGPLFCLLFNTSNAPVVLKRRQHYATLEFHRLTRPTYRYRGKYQGQGLLHYLPGNAALGAINELKKELEAVRKESRFLQTMTWAVLSLILAIIAVWVSVR